ncbi:MAG: putative peptidoglycan glycosyltransferase FtsW [Bacteroidota bacterium]
MQTDRNHIDLPTLFAVLTLLVLSLGVVYSASSTWALTRHGGSEWLLGKHATKVFISFLTIFVFMRIDYKAFKRYTKPVLIGAVLLLLVTLAMGGEVKGASRWLRLGDVGFQPSEFAKYALLFHLCAMMAAKGEAVRDFNSGFLPMLVWIGTVTVLVLLQPNFSTAAMTIAISFVMLFVGRAKLRHVALTVSTLIPLLLVFAVGADYRLRRILAFLAGSETDSDEANYQVWQGIIGFGNGGIFGLGPGASRQREGFLPQPFDDFVYSIIGEEYGLIGTVLVVALFLIVMLRGMKIARYARDEFGMFLAIGITSTITLYGLVNAGVALGVLPTTGLPMPFVSYGGSSIFFSAIAIGVLLNISSQTDMYPRLAPTADGVRPMEPSKSAVGKVY